MLCFAFAFVCARLNQVIHEHFYFCVLAFVRVSYAVFVVVFVCVCFNSYEKCIHRHRGFCTLCVPLYEGVPICVCALNLFIRTHFGFFLGFFVYLLGLIFECIHRHRGFCTLCVPL